jgi:hypothetical protein
LRSNPLASKKGEGGVATLSSARFFIIILPPLQRRGRIKIIIVVPLLWSLATLRVTRGLLARGRRGSLRLEGGLPLFILNLI